jgi:cell division protein FtsB
MQDPDANVLEMINGVGPNGVGDVEMRNQIARETAKISKMKAKAAEVEAQIARIQKGAHGHHGHDLYAQVGSFNPNTDEYIELA